MTSSSENYPTRVIVNNENKKGWIVSDQIRRVDRQRVIKIPENLGAEQMQEVKGILKETYVD